MSLQSHHTSFVLDSANPTWEGDLLYLLKVAENNPLFRHPSNAELLKVHWDGDKSLAVRYVFGEDPTLRYELEGKDKTRKWVA